MDAFFLAIKQNLVFMFFDVASAIIQWDGPMKNGTSYSYGALRRGSRR
jgi:hypothetical protein